MIPREPADMPYFVAALDKPDTTFGIFHRTDLYPSTVTPKTSNGFAVHLTDTTSLGFTLHRKAEKYDAAIEDYILEEISGTDFEALASKTRRRAGAISARSASPSPPRPPHPPRSPHAA